MILSNRFYRSLTDLPSPAYLQEWRASLIRPIARTNLIINPSFETNTTSYTAVGGSIARSTTESYHGAYSLAVTPTAATTDGVYYGTVSLTSGTTYAASVKIKVPNAAGKRYRLAFATTAGVMLQTTEFIATGYWQWITCIYKETSTTTRRIYVTKNGGTETAIFYLDGVQCEACETDNYFATTYIDGDQRGLLGDLESTPAYYWTGTPHASTSARGGQTRAGGQIVKLTQYGFFLTAIMGLGLAPVTPVVTSFGQLDGSQFLDQRAESRSDIVLSGRWQATTPRQQQRLAANLTNDLSRDYIATRQPMTLAFEPMVDDRPIRAPILVPGVTLTGGLEGTIQDSPTNDVNLSFTQYIPLILNGEDGVSLTTQSSLTMNMIAQRSPAGQWAAMSTGMTGVGGYVTALRYGLDGTLFAAGNFTDAGGSGADNIAKWDGSTWAVLASATALNNVVNQNALVVSAANLLYVGGDFTDANGNVNADRIATWNGSTWSNLSTGANDSVDAIAIAPDGTVYAVGNYNNIGGVALGLIAKWNGSAWSAVGSGVGANLEVFAVVVLANGNVVIGGDFTTVDGVAAQRVALWNGSAWSSLGNANGTVNALAVGPNGLIYAAGAFTTIGGISANRIAVYNGVSWAPLGTGFNSTVNNLLVDNRGGIYAVGVFSTAGSITTPDGSAYWNGSAWVYLDIDTPAVALVNPVMALALAPDGTLTLGISTTGAATAAGVTTLTNTNSQVVYPTVVITNPTAANVRIYSMRNTTTSKNIYFNLTLLPSEVVTLVLDPVRISLVSNTRGNLLSTILPGSDVSSFALQPGANTISFFSASSSVTAVMSWPVVTASLNEGWIK